MWRLTYLLTLLALAIVPTAGAQTASGPSKPPQQKPIQHVLLLSIDGMHALDLARLVREMPDSTLAQLSANGITYTNARTTFPSNSWPGLLAMITGGTPNSTGAIFENEYDRSLSPPGSDCSKVGTVIRYDSFIDKNRDALDGGGGIDPDKLPRDPKKGCAPVFPHNFIRVNTIFEVIKQNGGRTAWSDKHPAYEFVHGPSGSGVDDLFVPELRALGRLGTQAKVEHVMAYDDAKVQAILNQIEGKDHTGSKQVGVPTIFGMNFQAVSIGQKLAGNGYLDESGTPSPALLAAFQHTDQSIGKMVGKLRERGLLDSTLIIITAKHGDTPISPHDLKIANLELIPKAIESVDKNLIAAINQDGSVAMVWLRDQGRTPEVVAALNKIKTEANIQHIYYGDSLKLRFNDPKTDPRVPDIIVQPVMGQIYVDNDFVAEHGGETGPDSHVALLISNPRLSRRELKAPVHTTQIAPTILKALGLNPAALQAVQQEHTSTLPALGF